MKISKGFKDRIKDSGFITITEAAKRTSFHRTTIYRWARTHAIKSELVNSITYVQWDSIIKHIGKDAPTIATLIASSH